MKPFLNILIAAMCCFQASVFAQTGSAAKESKDGEWTIVETFTVPGKASGLAWDGQFIYFGQYGVAGAQIQKLDPATGNISFVCNGPQEDAYGLTWDGQYLWTTDHPGSYDPGIAYQFDLSGAVNYQFELPATYMGGIAYDNGLFWTAAYYNPDGRIFKVDNQGNVLKEFPTPGAQPWDICLQNEFLWIADYNDNKLYKVDTISGALIETHFTEDQKPAGVVYDGQFLWYVDGQLSSPSTIYKVDLGGVGTPVISVPVTSWNYGNVAVGDSTVWDMVISNIGTYELSVDNVLIQNAVPIFSWEVYPQIIAPGNSIEITLIFKPTEVGSLNTIITIQSSDPVTPEVEVTLTGEAVISGPSIYLPETSHNYGDVRLNATTRWFLPVVNIGDANLVINGLTLSDPAFYRDENIVFPITLAPLETTEIGVWFNPVEAIDYTANLTIFNNDPSQPAIGLSVLGNGDEQSFPMGEMFWQYVIDAGWDNSPKAIGSIQDVTGDYVRDVIVGSEDNFVRCFNGNAAGTGDVIWEYEIYAGNTYQQNCLSFLEDINQDGFQDVVFGTSGGDRSVTALSGKTGTLLWTFPTNMWGDGGWVYQVDVKYDYSGDGVKDVLACAGNDGTNTGPKRAFCLDGITGSLIWSAPTGGPAFSVIGIEDVNNDGQPDAFVGASNVSETLGMVYCINGANGAVLWSQQASSTSVWALAQLDDATEDGLRDVAAGDFGGHLFGYNGTDGDILWLRNMSGAPIVLRFERFGDVNDDGLADVLVSSSSNNCIVISGADGSNIWLTPLADKAWNIDRISDVNGDAINDVLVGTLYTNNYAYFLDGLNGNILKAINFGQPVDAIAAIPNIDLDNISMEMVAGGREGKLVCYSGGPDAAWVSVPEKETSQNGIIIECSPNPFITETIISVSSAIEHNLSISIFSAGGRLVYDFGNTKVSSSKSSLTWNGLDLNGTKAPRGLYFIIVEEGVHQKITKVIKY
jgi:outer membrane protein assembly factor BamB